MTTSEIAFLALGLVLGAAVGAALAQAMRDRPASHGEVRLTITPNAIPAGRTRTLAARDGSARPGAFPGSPEAVALADALPGTIVASRADTASQGALVRTRVPSVPVTLPPTAIGVPVGRERPAPTLPAGASAVMAPPVAGRAAVPPPVAPAPAQAKPAPATALAQGAPRATAATTTSPGARAGIPPASVPVMAAGAAAPAPSANAGVATLQAPRMAKPAARDGFTMLVRPRAPAEEPRPRLAVDAIAVAVTDVPARAARTPIPPTRLAPPSGPTLTLPRMAAPTVLARPAPTASGIARPVPVRPRGDAARGEAARGEAARGEGPGTAGAPGTASPRPDPSADPCGGSRRMVEERCALAGVARDQAKAALDALREAQRAYDVLRDRVDRAESIVDPRRVAAEKDRLHAAFRAATERASGTEETEAAARLWLDEINALNASVREAQRIADTGGAELRAAHPTLARLSAEADSARIAAENAEAGCREARQELSDCEEAATRARQAPPPPPEEPAPAPGPWPLDRPDLPDPEREPAIGDPLGGYPAVVRILRGDRDARERLVATLAGGEPDTEREWQLRIARLVDAIGGRAIEDGYLDTPEDHPFWRLFERREARDIVGALSALGFRYDGLGGFADGRVPAARDLSLAVGYAGLDRMRIRTWPRESEIAALYAQVVVAADEWLSDQAGDLSLGRMVDALGGRAAELADIWNAWGRVRPALLAR